MRIKSGIVYSSRVLFDAMSHFFTKNILEIDFRKSWIEVSMVNNSSNLQKTFLQTNSLDFYGILSKIDRF